VNYYDTAYGYHQGRSEVVLDAALSRYPRESYYLADKFPGYDLNNMGKVKEIFAEQLQRTGAGYFDFYLIHNVCELNIDAYLDPSYGTMEHLRAQKAAGKIRHLGFSVHGSLEVCKRFLDEFGSEMEFCQIQLNYLDWEFQNARAKVELLKQWGIPVWVMEPLRGGKLVSLPQEYSRRLDSLRPGMSAKDWAFRFVQSVPGVVVTLSGMSTLEQVRDNLTTFETDSPLSDAELSALLGMAKEMTARGSLPCTACRYCTAHCPQGLDIPWLLGLYNEHVFSDGGFLAPMAISSVDEGKRPSACVGCRSCEAVCPQQIKISEAMSDFAEKLKG